jgi:hypothetical protein
VRLTIKLWIKDWLGGGGGRDRPGSRHGSTGEMTRPLMWVFWCFEGRLYIVYTEAGKVTESWPSMASCLVYRWEEWPGRCDL